MISELLRDVASRNRRAIAVVDGSERITFGGLLERVLATREWLRSALDPKSGDVIALSLDNSSQSVAVCFAISELGCAAMPCNTQWRAAELRVFVNRLGFRGAIIESRLSAEWNQIQDLIPSSRLLTADRAPTGIDPDGALNLPPTKPTAEDAPAIYLSTSGSTGAPRLVPRTHRNLIANARNVARALNIGPGHRFLSVVPFSYANGLNNSLLLPLLNGATMVMMRRFSPSACAELVHREKVNTLFGSPFIYQSLANGIGDPSLLSSLKWCFNAGGRIPANVVENWRVRFGVSIRQLYGMTEAGVIAIEETTPAPVASLGACIGAPIGGVDAIVLGAQGQCLEQGEIGELAVQSEAVMPGYHGEPKRVGFFRTGDLGYFDASGNLHLTGRMGRLMNIAGVKVHPVEVERTVEMLPSVASCHVDTVSNGHQGEVIRARVVPREGFSLERREIIEHCRRHLAEYKLPRIIEFLESTPVTIAGKLPRSEPPDTGPEVPPSPPGSF